MSKLGFNYNGIQEDNKWGSTLDTVLVNKLKVNKAGILDRNEGYGRDDRDISILQNWQDGAFLKSLVKLANWRSVTTAPQPSENAVIFMGKDA